ncbi:hypothetical protein DFH29DRAFT_1005196 [Suillus ampliporus]|nr:hypothetical protein DFH29DRAFT_1005196 [Suillus ampliporus]
MPPQAPIIIEGCSLADFNDIFFRIIEQDNIPPEEYYRACNLALTGKDTHRNVQYSMEPTRNGFVAPRVVRVVRDYDSIISFTDWLPVTSDLFLYPVTNPDDTLKSSLHLKVPMKTSSREPPIPLSPHRVPNICLASVGIRTKVRAFFPRLYDPESQDVELTQEQKKGIYEKGVRPVIEELNYETSTNWSTDYEGALTRATKRNNRYQYSTRPFPANMVSRFGYELRLALIDVFPWARDMLFMVQVQGVKEVNQHKPDDEHVATTALRRAMHDLDYLGLLDETHCYIDVGLELSEPNYAYQWRTDAHGKIILAYTTSYNARTAAAVTRTRSYQKDCASGLMHVAGFRVTLAARDPNEPVYMQAYTTDKALVHQLDGGRHGLALTGKAALSYITPPLMNNMYRLFNHAAQHHDCAARLEVRLPISAAVRSALSVPVELMSQSLCVFPRVDWW